MIKRSKRKSNFSIISNSVFLSELSFETMGLLSYLLSKPDNWEVKPKLLAKITHGTDKKTGENKIYSMLNVLMEKGFIVRKKFADGSVEYTVFDEPVSTKKQQKNNKKPDDGNSEQDNPDDGKPHHGNPNEAFRDTLINTDFKQELNKNKKEKEKEKSVREKIESFSGKKINSDFLSKNLGVFSQVAEDWLTARKTHLTKTALLGVLAQAEKANIDLPTAIAFSAENGWQGFNAEWYFRQLVNASGNSGSNQNISSSYEGHTPKGWGQAK